MKPYIVKHKEFLDFFVNLPSKSKRHLIPALNRGQVNTISEICKNFLNHTLTSDPKIIKKVKPAKKEINVVSLKKTPLYKKKKILQSRKGGAILSVLLPLAASLFTSLFTRKS